MTALRPLTFALLLVLVGCSTVPKRIARLEPLPSATTVTSMSVPYPIILLHGLGQKAEAWNGTATRYFLEDLYLRSGGTLHVKNGTVRTSLTGGSEGDIYILSFSNPHDSVNAWRDELDIAIRHVLDHTGADRVILIGYSMGGLAARSYLVKRYTDHHVKRLITVGTPHLGSAYAKVWTWKSELESCVNSGNIVTVPLCKAALAAIQGTEGDVPYDAPAVRDLRRPEDGGDFLRKLGKYAHPLDVEYVSVIGDVDVSDEIQKLSDAAIQELLRKALSIVGGGVDEVFEGGDGVVSRKSQDIMNIEYFTVDPSRRRAARTIEVGSVHMEHLQQSTEVQRMSLDEKPELKGAGLFRQGDSAALVVTYADHIPAQCTVTMTVLVNEAVVYTVTSPSGKNELIRTSDGIVARVIFPLASSLFPDDQHARATFTITNAFGYVAKSSVEF